MGDGVDVDPARGLLEPNPFSCRRLALSLFCFILPAFSLLVVFSFVLVFLVFFSLFGFGCDPWPLAEGIRSCAVASLSRYHCSQFVLWLIVLCVSVLSVCVASFSGKKVHP